MSKTKLKYVKYTKQELQEYVQDKSSCVNLINNNLHIGFPPWGLSSFRESLQFIIQRDKIGKYDSKLNGIVLDVGNIKVSGTKFAVHDDDPYNHIDINANFYIFQPLIGATIKGIVKHISHGHVAVIIYRVFNVSIRFKKTNQYLQINQEISFKIKHFDLQDGMPYIEGELIADGPAQTKRRIVFDDDEAGSTPDSGISTEGSGKGAKKPVAPKDSSESSSGSSSESEQEEKISFKRVKVKQEKESGSESSEDELPSKNTLKKQKSPNKRRAKSSSSSSSSKSGSSSSSSSSSSSRSSSSSSDEDAPRGPAKNIKKEKQSSSGQSSSDSDGEEVARSKKDSVTFKKPTSGNGLVKVKRERSSQESASESDGFKKPFEVPNGSSNGNRKRNRSFNDHLDGLLQDTLSEAEGSPRKKKADQSATKSKRKSVQFASDVTFSNAPAEMSFANLSAFGSPALSSTLKSSGKKKTKTIDLSLESVLEELDSTLQETVTDGAKKSKSRKSTNELNKTANDEVSESEKGKTKKNKKKKSDRSLADAEADLLSSFLN